MDLIHTREKVFNRILGISTEDINNNFQGASNDITGISLATHLMETVNNFKNQMISPDGKTIDYASLARNEQYQILRSELTPRLRKFNPASLKTNAERLAFWVNLYNVLIIDSVIEFGVDTSVIDGFLGILRYFRLAAYDIGGCRTSLEDIEHGILRGNRGNPYIPGAHFSKNDLRLAWVIKDFDPRIHFVLNCASISCPPIGVYSPKQIHQQLELATRNFISSDVTFNPDTNTLHLSSIFKWFAVDFGGKEGIIYFIQDYHLKGKGIWSNLDPNRIRFKFAPYDWGLNKKF